jgi:uncharacterized repeat protein (TIGR01451 family)
VTDSFSITKSVVDPNGAVDPAATFTGTYSCQYGTDAPVVGSWSITPATNPTFTVNDLLLTSTCTVTEDDPGRTGLPDDSWIWGTPVVSEPVTVVPGGTATVTATNTVERLYGGLQVTKTVVDPDNGVLPGAQFLGVWTCLFGGTEYSDRFSVGADATSVLVTPADQRVPAGSLCSLTEDTPDPADLVDASFAFDTPSLEPPDVVLAPNETANLGLTNTVIRVYSDVTVQKVVTGPAAGLVDSSRVYTGTTTCQYRSEAPIVATWAATTQTPDLRSGVLVGSVCSAVEDDPGFTGQPVAGDRSYVWGEQIVSAPVTVAPPEAATPPIVVTNPTGRQFGTFTVTKAVTGATDGIVDPTQPFPMAFSCQPGTGDPISGEIEVVAAQVLTIGPAEELPVGSVCTLSELADGQPDLRDSAWTWNEPTFTVDGLPVTATDRTITFTIPEPTEDFPSPTVAVGVGNDVAFQPGAFTVTKSADPASGTQVQPGSTITYTLTVDATGAVPIHNVVVVDDLSGVLENASLVGGSIVAPDGTTANVDTAAGQLVWTLAAVPNGEQRTLTYQVVVDDDAYGVPITNLLTSVGSNCDPVSVGAGPRRTIVQAPGIGCQTEHTTPQAPVAPPAGPDQPGLPDTGYSLAALLWWIAVCLGVGGLVIVLARRLRQD